MDQQSENPPVHLLVYRRLREMILFGELAPGQPVTILGLTERLGAGMTPVREALRRLTAEGALQALGNRRVVVPELDEAALKEVAFARLALEPKLAEMACIRLTKNEINKIFDQDEALNLAIARGDVVEYLRRNFNFHMAIYEKAGAPILLSLCRALWVRVGPSLRVVCGRWGTMQLADCHAQALNAMRAGDGPALGRAIADDIQQGLDLIRDSMTDLKI